jgi:cell division protein FtsB
LNTTSTKKRDRAGPKRLYLPLATIAISWQSDAVSKLPLFLERGLPVLILVVAAIGAPALMLSQEGLPRLRTLKAEMAQVEAENAELTENIRQLRVEVEKLKRDPKAVERIARDELGLVRNTEVVFQFPAQP